MWRPMVAAAIYRWQGQFPELLIRKDWASSELSKHVSVQKWLYVNLWEILNNRHVNEANLYIPNTYIYTWKNASCAVPALFSFAKFCTSAKCVPKTCKRLNCLKKLLWEWFYAMIWVFLFSLPMTFRTVQHRFPLSLVSVVFMWTLVAFWYIYCAE